ncbi:hypothetical protein NL676_021815 [Syzygium grande]|nr:hypothetical protein NL676_021815 [Syzygium grande]
MQPATKPRLKVVPTAAADGGNSADDKRDQLVLSSATCKKTEDLGPFVRKAFAIGKPNILRDRGASTRPTTCRTPILAVGDLRPPHFPRRSPSRPPSPAPTPPLQSVALPPLNSPDACLEAGNISVNINLTVGSCVGLVDLSAPSAPGPISTFSYGNFYMALKCVDAVEAQFLGRTPSCRIKSVVEKKILENSILHGEEGEQGVRRCACGDS